MVFLLIIVVLTMAGLQVPGLVRQKMWRELAAFSVFLLVGTALSLMLALDIHLPNPNKPFEMIYGPLVRWMMAK